MPFGPSRLSAYLGHLVGRLPSNSAPTGLQSLALLGFGLPPIQSAHICGSLVAFLQRAKRIHNIVGHLCEIKHLLESFARHSGESKTVEVFCLDSHFYKIASTILTKGP